MNLAFYVPVSEPALKLKHR